MKVAVLMSTYNGAAFLKQQIESILAQQGDFSLDLWVRDDGSSDLTQNILQEYADQDKLRWYTGENRKPAHSFFDLILHCPGYDYYAFADQDDLWLPDKLQRGISALQETCEPTLFVANATLVDGNLESLGRNVYTRTPRLDFYTLSCAGGLLGCTMVWNRPLAELLQSQPMPGPIVMHDFYVALVCLLAGGKILYDAESRMLYRQHGNNVVGAAHNKLSAIKNRIRTITQRRPVTVGQQAHTLLSQYSHLGTTEQHLWLKKLSDPRFFARIGIACSKKTCYISANKSLTLRLAILFGNR